MLNDGKHGRHEAEWRDEVRHGKMTRYFLTDSFNYSNVKGKIFNETYSEGTLVLKKEITNQPDHVFY